MTDIESLRLLTEAVETAGADIAPTYAEYVQLAFAIATDCGEAGREFFHRLCRISAKYQSAHAERMFSNALTKQQGAIHLGTAFHLAESTGVKICKEARKEVMNNRTGTVGTESSPHNFSTHAHVYNKVEEEKSESEELLEGSDPHHPLPTFTLEDWPKLLLRIISYGTTVTQKDVLLLGALTALGATMERYVRCHYAGKYQSPCMQSFIVAPAASGKGVLSLIRLLVMPIHDDIRQQVEKEMNAYKKAKVAYEMMGLICETEADTISTAIGSEYGHWSETLRRAFDHDWLAYNRRTNQEYRENKKSYLSLLLSGTPAQVKPLIPSVENGLFSRQLFYYMHGIYQWINQFDENEIDLEAIFTAIGLEWNKLLNLLKEHGLHTLRLTDEQKQEFNDLFSELFTRSTIANGREMNSSIARMAVNICRIMSVVAMLRALENPQPYQYQASSHPLLTPDKEIAADNIKDGIITRWDMTITPEDFKAVLNLVKPLYQHATHILSFLPPSEVSHRANADRDAFFEALGIQFTRAQLVEQATTMGIKPNTALTWLKRLVKQGLIVNLDGKGTYAHARACVC